MPLPSLTTLFDPLLSRTPPAPAGPATVGRKEVRSRLGGALEAMLVAAGFSPFKCGVAWRHGPDWVDVVQIQFMPTHHTSPHSPALEAGRFLNVIPQCYPEQPLRFEDGRFWPTPEQCHIRKVVIKPVQQAKTPANIWAIGPDGEGLEACLAQAVQVTQQELLPWFHWLDDWETLLALLLGGKSDVEGKSGDPRMRGTWNYADYFGKHVLGGTVALRLERWALALELLEPVLRQGGAQGRNGQVFPLTPATMAVIEEACAQARRQLS
jgi:hypothetical protein